MSTDHRTSGPRSINAAQFRAARHLASLSQSDLAEAAQLSLPTIKRVESDLDVPLSDAARDKVRRALEDAGIEFLTGSRPGVRWRNPRSPW